MACNYTIIFPPQINIWPFRIEWPFPSPSSHHHHLDESGLGKETWILHLLLLFNLRTMTIVAVEEWQVDHATFSEFIDPHSSFKRSPICCWRWHCTWYLDSHLHRRTGAKGHFFYSSQEGGPGDKWGGGVPCAGGQVNRRLGATCKTIIKLGQCDYARWGLECLVGSRSSSDNLVSTKKFKDTITTPPTLYLINDNLIYAFHKLDLWIGLWSQGDG